MGEKPSIMGQSFTLCRVYSNNPSEEKENVGRR